jgi:hypothetical protein
MMILSTDVYIKYTGCHLEQTDATRAQDFFERESDLKTNTALAKNARTAAAMQHVAVGRTIVPFEPKYPLMHSEWNALLRSVIRHAQHTNVIMDEARRQRNWFSCMMPNARTETLRAYVPFPTRVTVNRLQPLHEMCGQRHY